MYWLSTTRMVLRWFRQIETCPAKRRPARASVDGFALGLLAGRLLPELRKQIQPYALTAMAGAGALALVALFDSLTLRFVVVAVVLLGFAGAKWFRILDSTERRLLLLFAHRG